MQTSYSVLPWSLEYVAPSADCLLSFDVEGSNLDIEEGLCTSNDQEVFLTASMAFLQNHLARKLRNDIYSRFRRKLHRPQKTYSDLLLVESQSKFRREKYFIRLKNIERYDEILRNEASTPRRTLSLNQILPAPKKTVWPNPPRLFRLKPAPKTSISRSLAPEQSRGFLGSLKRNFFRPKSSSSSAGEEPKGYTESQFSKNETKLKQRRCQLYVDGLPSRTSSVATSASFRNWNEGSSIGSLAVNRLKMAPSFVNPWKFCSNATLFSTLEADSCGIKSIKIKAGSSISHCSSNKKLGLTRSELEIFRWISGQPPRCLKQSLSGQIREVKNHCNYIQSNYGTRTELLSEYSSSTTSYGTLAFSSNSSVNVLARCNAQTKLKPQQSKLSVFIEEESEDEEIPNYPSVCTNFTDELKSKFSSEYVPALIVRRLIDESKGNFWLPKKHRK